MPRLKLKYAVFLVATSHLAEAITPACVTAPTPAQATTKSCWDARAIVGWHQAGASSADFKQNLFFDFFVARPFGLDDAEVLAQGQFFDWGRTQVQVAAFWAVGLSHHGLDLHVGRFDERLEAGTRQFRGAHEDDA